MNSTWLNLLVIGALSVPGASHASNTAGTKIGLKASSAPRPALETAEQRAERIIIPELSFASNTLAECLERLRVKGMQNDPEGRGVPMVPDKGLLESTPDLVSLDVKDVSLKLALLYVTELAGVRVTWSDNAARIVSGETPDRPFLSLRMAFKIVTPDGMAVVEGKRDAKTQAGLSICPVCDPYQVMLKLAHVGVQGVRVEARIQKKGDDGRWWTLTSPTLHTLLDQPASIVADADDGKTCSLEVTVSKFARKP